MTLIQLRPTEAEIKVAHSHLLEMIEYIETLLSQSDPQVVAQNASFVYLAVMTAFTKKGLLQLAWAPRVSIEIGAQDYEVRFTVSLAVQLEVDLFPILDRLECGQRNDCIRGDKSLSTLFIQEV